MEFFWRSLLIGAGATLVFDLWLYALNRIFGLPRPDWAVAGRWFAHVAQGRVWHDDIGAEPAIPGEAVIGWAGHYAVGVLYAAMLLTLWGMGWATAPTLTPALTVGVVTIAAGWFLMSPGMGGGIAASRAENPWKARALGLLAHVVFGFGLWATALVTRGL